MWKHFVVLLTLLPMVASAGDPYEWPDIYSWPAVEATPVKLVPSFIQKRATSEPLQALVRRKDNCEWCDKQEKDVKNWKGSPVKFVKVDKLPIEWDSDAAPVTCWRGKDGKWWAYEGWYGREHFLTEYNRSQGIKPKATYHTRWSNWNGPDKLPFGSRQAAIDHLLTDGIHAGRFSREILEALTFEQLKALHSDHHEGRVNWKSLKQ